MPVRVGASLEGPYRDLGSGFARLAGAEGARRAPSRIASVEDALFELLRNARDAGARNVYVASALSRRRYRTLTVLDDGAGIPDRYADLVFEPGVTTRHLEPRPEPTGSAAHPLPAPHGAGMSLYHVRNAAFGAAFVSTSNPTSVRATFDTRTLQERTLQSGSRTSRSNLLATLRNFLLHHAPPGQLAGYYGPPARVLTTLLQNRIIQPGSPTELWKSGRELGLELSSRTAARIWRSEVQPLPEVEWGAGGGVSGLGWAEAPEEAGAPTGGLRVFLDREEISGIAAILSGAARSSYMEIGEVEVNSRPGEIVLRARVYEPEDEYE